MVTPGCDKSILQCFRLTKTQGCWSHGTQLELDRVCAEPSRGGNVFLKGGTRASLRPDPARSPPGALPSPWLPGAAPQGTITLSWRRLKTSQKEQTRIPNRCVHPLPGSAGTAEHRITASLPLSVQINEQSEEHPPNIPRWAGARVP